MALQTEYLDRVVAGFPGQMSDTGFYDNDSMTVVTADVPFGAPVAYGTEDRTCRPTETGDTLIAGVAIRTQGGRPESGDFFKVGETASIMKKGRMYVTTSVAVAAGEPVRVILATGEWTNTGGLAIAGAVYETSADADGVAVIRIT